MDLNSKLALLDRIYEIYDDFSNDIVVACKRGCSRCCTCHVTLTTIEAYKMVSYLEATQKPEFFEKIRIGMGAHRFRPQITTNTLADLCARGEPVPEEMEATSRGKCPLLTDDECPIYPVRPFGCRCFVSKEICREQGWAEIDPFVLTVNTLFLQCIEHLDARGASGNLADVLFFMESKDNRKRYWTNGLKHVESGLISNRAMKVLMIPPEHRMKAKPILDRIQRINAQSASPG